MILCGAAFDLIELFIKSICHHIICGIFIESIIINSNSIVLKIDMPPQVNLFYRIDIY